MAIINQSNILNLQPGITAPVVVHMSEGDSGTKLSFKLIDGARAWTDPGNVVAAVHGRRQDGTQFGPYACLISGDVVSFETDAAMAGAAGSGIAEIVLTDSNDNTTGSANFAVMVERATFPMGVTYTNDKSVYEAILRYVQTIPAQVTAGYVARIASEAAARETADNDLKNDLNTLQSGLNAEIAERTTQDAVLSARMDEFARLPDGSLSTAADAELADVRVMANGRTASTAGDAVREQVTGLKSDISELQNGLYYPTNVAELEITTSNQSIKNDGTFANAGGYSLRVTIPGDCDYVDFVAAIYMSNASAPYPVTAFTDSEGNILKTTAAGTYTNNRKYSEDVPAGAKYFYINTWNTTGTIYSGKRVYSIPYTIKDLVNTEFYPFSWTNRIYYRGTGNRAIDTTRIGLAEIVQAKTNFKVSVTTDLDVTLIVFSTNVESVATEQRFVNWVKSTIVYEGEYFLLNVRKTDNSAIGPNEIYNKLTIDKYAAANGSVTGVDGIGRNVLSKQIGTLTSYQSFCIYDNKYYSTDGDNISIQESDFTPLSTTPLTVGHGNNFQLGSNQKAYISGWSDNKLYVIDMDNVEIDSVIALPTTGYTTAVVDDVNNIAYIFQRSSNPSGSITNYNFITYDLTNQEILSTTKLTNSFGAMQAADFYLGRIYVAYGLGTATIPSGLCVYDTNGTILAEYDLELLSDLEPEGVCFNRLTKELLISDVNKKVYSIT